MKWSLPYLAHLKRIVLYTKQSTETILLTYLGVIYSTTSAILFIASICQHYKCILNPEYALKFYETRWYPLN